MVAVKDMEDSNFFNDWLIFFKREAFFLQEASFFCPKVCFAFEFQIQIKCKPPSFKKNLPDTFDFQLTMTANYDFHYFKI